MAPAPRDNNSLHYLKATYAGPNSTTIFTQRLPSTSVSTTHEKTHYLATLRGSIVKLQDEVNIFLTRKMEEEKAASSSTGGKVDEKVEEDNYGEENVNEEA